METETGRPIPKPRRTILESNKLKYENVIIDTTNKELRIEGANYDDNEDDNDNSSDDNKKENLAKKSYDDKKLDELSSPLNMDEIDFKNTKIVDIKENQNNESEKQAPVPAPRTPRRVVRNGAYVNVRNANMIGSGSNIDDDKCITYKGLEIPKQTTIKNDNDAQRSVSPISVSSSLENYGGGGVGGDYGLKKSISNSTIDSSMSSSDISDSQKYKSPPPSQLLKNLGTTSKLLTEAITERVTLKAKSAKHKLNENIKMSQDFLQSLGTDTASRIKSVRKKIHSPTKNDFSLSRHENCMQHEEQQRRHQHRSTVLNDQVFSTISFHSPLDKKSNTDRFSYSETYETPKNTLKKVNYLKNEDIDDDLPPSFEEAMRSCSYSLRNYETPSDMKSMPTASYKLRDENEIEDYRKSISPPMPNYPPPVLKQDEIKEASLQQPPQRPEDPIYGKVREIQPPARLKRKQRIERTAAAAAAAASLAHDIPSNRATVDSLELSAMSLECKSITEDSKNVSEDEEEVKFKDNRISNTSKSQSWTYYDRDDDDEDDGAASSPEPIYANQEATYDRLCEMETNDSDIILSPKFDENNANNSQAGATKFDEKEVLYEFDPLKKRNTMNDFSGNKSNELLLLEHLLVQDTYTENDGATLENEENQSLISSEEDNNSAVASTSCTLPQSPTQTQSFQENFRLPSGNSDDDKTMEPIIQSYLAKTDDVNPLNVITQSRSNWFVNCDDLQKSSSKLYNPLNKNNNQDISKKVSKTIALPKFPICGEEPPTYAEAIASGSISSSCSSSSGSSSLVVSNITQSNIVSSSSSVETKQQQKQQPIPEQLSSRPKVRSVLSNVMSKMDVLKRKTSFRSNRSSNPPKDTKVVLEMVPRPSISPLLVRHEGPLIRFPSGVVEDILNDMQNRKAILRDKKFITYHDHTMKNLKESFPLEYITTIQCVSNNKITDSFTQLYCFEITISIPKNQSSSTQQTLSNPNVIITSKDSGYSKIQRACHLYGVGKESERDIWMQKLIQSLTTVFPSNYTCQYYRAGWCYLKRSISSPWSGAWILLKKNKRKLLFYSEHEMNLEKVDLRKARCIVLKENDSTIKNLHVEFGPVLMVDCPPYTIYLIMTSPRETKIWRHIIREVAHNNGPSLNEQQITKFNVPVIVDKCINFVYIYGSMSEGIYRKSGSENSIQKLISQFRTNAFSVEITRPEYSEHDVANVLKRFMRDLPQKLLSRYTESFCSVTQIQIRADKISAYKELLNRLSVIEYQTLKKLMGHLSFIASLHSKNKMGIENLAMIWGPTILQNKEEQASYSQKEADVMSELIILYKDLFVLSADEIKKEQEMLMCLQKYYASGESLSSSMKKSGDLKVWITYNKEEKTQTNVSLTPTKTAYEVCKELSAKIKVPAYQLTLFEVILNENLERPLHHDEKVFDIVLRWSYWPEADRKNNYLVVRKYDILKEIERALRNLPTVTPSKELKFADNKTKSFKLLNVELRDTIVLIQRKEKNVINIVKEISLENTIAYLGCEKKREMSQHGWAITFIQKTDTNIATRSKDSPYVGHVIAGTEWKDRIIWFSSIWHCLYGDNVLPQPELVIQ